MAWIQSHQNLLRHPKLLNLSAISGKPIDICIAKLMRLWWWTLEYSEDGYLDKYNPKQLLLGIGFEPPEEGNGFYEGLLESGWIDKNENRIHDWWNYVGRFLQTKYKQHPEKWQRIKELYTKTNNRSKNPPKNGSKNPPKNGSKNSQDKIRKDKISKLIKAINDKGSVVDNFEIQKQKDALLEKEKKQEEFKRRITVIESRLKSKYPRFNLIKFFQNNISKNRDAIIYSIDRLLESPVESPETISHPESYCQTILDKESGNFNERESINQHEENKSIFTGLLNDIKKLNQEGMK